MNDKIMAEPTTALGWAGSTELERRFASALMLDPMLDKLVNDDVTVGQIKDAADRLARIAEAHITEQRTWAVTHSWGLCKGGRGVPERDHPTTEDIDRHNREQSARLDAARKRVDP